MAAALILAPASLLGMAGCDREENREQAVHQVLEADPAFARVLEAHRQLMNQIEAQERELDLKRLMVEQAVVQLRQDIAATERNVRLKQEKLRDGFAPENRALDAEEARTVAELDALKLRRAHVGAVMAQLRKAEPLAGTADAAPAPPEGLAEAQAAAARIEQELAILQRHLEIVRLKRRLIRL